MSGISTKEVSTGGGSLPKTFGPGNVKAKINSLRLSRPVFAKAGEKMYYLELDMETEPMGSGFEGFFIDKDNESLGRYLGQTGRIKSSQFPYKDSKNDAGKEFFLHIEVIKFLKRIEEECGTQYLDDNDGKFKTIEELVEKFNAAAPFKDTFLNWCLGGQKVMKDNKHYTYYLHIPKYEKGETTKHFVSDANIAMLTKYDAPIHLEDKTKTTVVQGFTGGPAAPAATEVSAFQAPSVSDDELFKV